jgi:hypothetical protein
MKWTIVAIALIVSASASAQQMIGPAFNPSRETMRIWTEQTAAVNADIERNRTARLCQWQQACIDKTVQR